MNQGASREGLGWGEDVWVIPGLYRPSLDAELGAELFTHMHFSLVGQLTV